MFSMVFELSNVVLRTFLLIFASFTVFVVPGLLLTILSRYKLKYNINGPESIFIIIGVSIVFSSLIGIIFIYLNIKFSKQNIFYIILLEYIILIFLILIFRKEIYMDLKSLTLIAYNPKLLNKVLLIIILILIVTIFRYIPVIGKPSAPIHYDGCVCYFYRYLLIHGKRPPKIEIYGLYDQNVNDPGGPTPVLVTLNVLFQKISDLPGEYSFSLVHVVLNSRLLIISIFLNIMLISVILAIISNSKFYISFVDQCLAVLFTLLGSSVLIMYLTGWNAGYGFVYITSSLYLLAQLLEEGDNCIFYKFVLIIFIYFIVLLYHTAALVCEIMVISLYICSFIDKDIKKVRSITMTYSIFFVAYLVYLYKSFYGTIMSEFKRIFNYGMNSIKIDVPFHRNPFADPVYITIYAISIITGAIPILIWIYYEFRRKINTDKYTHIVRIYILSYILSLIVWFMYMGLTGLIHRGKEYLAYLSVFVFPILLRKFSNKEFKITTLKICIIIAIATSMYVYTGSIEHVYHLTESEYDGSIWLIKHINNSEVIFTDLRLSANFVANGYFKVLGVLDPPRINTKTLIYRLNAIFYGNNSTNAAIALYRIITLSREHIDYIFFSKRMAICKDSTGIYGYDYQFKPAPMSFTDKYDNCNLFEKIYCNGVINIYKFDYRKVKKFLLNK